MCSDEHRLHDFVSLVRHNPGYANAQLLAEHRSLVRELSSRVGGEVTDLSNRRFEGFAVHFRSSYDTDNTILARTKTAIEHGDHAVWKAVLAGAFDGRASYDRRRGTQANTQFVVDCPQTNELKIADLIVSLARRLGIGVNTNYSRERLEGGNPRKTQLRLRASDAERFFTQIGLISPEKLQRACELYGCDTTIERDADALPGIKVVAGRKGMVSSRSAQTPSATPVRQRSSVTSDTVGNAARTNSMTSDTTPFVKPVVTELVVDSKPLVTRKRLTEDERAAIQIGGRVTHKAFGEGIITSMDNEYIRVKIGGKERVFAWPGAFEDGFLKIRK